MKILIDTSVLVSGSIMWEHAEAAGSYLLIHKHFKRCDMFFSFLRMNSSLELGIITKTVENEAKSVLKKAVTITITSKWKKLPDFIRIKKLLVLQSIVFNKSLDRMENIIEECSIRLPIDIKVRNEIKANEIEPFLKKLVPKTVRYRQPSIPGYLAGAQFREELTKLLLENAPAKQIVYKGMPGDRDLTIMAEATFISRKYGGKESIYVASMDNNFKPNPVQIGSYMSNYENPYDGTLDSTVRDALAKNFGFIGEEPSELMNVLKREVPAATFPK